MTASLVARVVGIGCAALVALPHGARAVDRTIGADVAKPPLAGAPWTPAEIVALQRDLDATLARVPALRRAHVGAIVQTAADDVRLYERRPDDAFQPASTLKLVTGSVALERLGRAYRFSTTVERAANDAAAGTTLILRGGGDPLLASADLEAAAAAVARLGLPGPLEVRLDTSHVAPGDRHPAGWSFDDVLGSYAPVVNGLPFEENVLHASVVPAATVGAAPAVSVPAPFVLQPPAAEPCREGPTLLAFTVEATTVAAGTPSTIDVTRGRCGDIVVTGAIPQGAPEPIDVAVEQPEALALGAFADALRRRGAEVRDGPAAFAAPPDVRAAPDRPAPAGTILWQHAGEPLTDLLADMWLPSDNLVAEMLLRELDVRANARAGSAAGGTAVERAWFASLGIDPGTLTLSDGSGLSQYNRISPRALVAVLRHDWRGPGRDVVLDDLSIAGVRGTLRGQMRGSAAEGRVFAKDGEMSHVRGLAGYIATRTHGSVTFALLIDDWIGNDADLKAARSAFCARLAGA